MTDDTSITFDETVPDNAPAVPEPAARQKVSSPSRPSASSRSTGQRRASFIPRVAEWLGLQPAIEAAQLERKQARKAAQTAFQAELAAGRALDPSQSEARSAELPVHVHRATGPNASLADFSIAVAQSRSTNPPPDLERHSRLCSVCSHPDRDAIEADYLHWRNPAEIAEDYGLPNFYPIYRHARATGLIDRRKGEVCRVMERYLEKVDSYTTDEFDQVTRAVRAYAHIDADGRWFEPSRTHYILTGQIASVMPDAFQQSAPGAEFAEGRESHR